MERLLLHPQSVERHGVRVLEALVDSAGRRVVRQLVVELLARRKQAYDRIMSTTGS